MAGPHWEKLVPLPESWHAFWILVDASIAAATHCWYKLWFVMVQWGLLPVNALLNADGQFNPPIVLAEIFIWKSPMETGLPSLHLSVPLLAAALPLLSTLHTPPASCALLPKQDPWSCASEQAPVEGGWHLGPAGLGAVVPVPEGFVPVPADVETAFRPGRLGIARLIRAGLMV